MFIEVVCSRTFPSNYIFVSFHSFWGTSVRSTVIFFSPSFFHLMDLSFFLFFFLMFISERQRERERERASGTGAEREGDTEPETGPKPRAVSTEPDVGLEPTN